MAKLEFESLSFDEHESMLRASFLRVFYFEIEKSLLLKIGRYAAGDNFIEFYGVPYNRARRRFDDLLSRGFAGLKSSISGNRAVYVHRNSGIPLIGCTSFGLVDRNTSLIDVRPITGCNLNCIFCSVDAGPKSRNKTDFVVECDYLVDGFRRLAELKGCDVEAHIGTQGEPLLYQDIVQLVKGLAGIEQVKAVSIDTNGTLLTEGLVDKLAEAGLKRINLSLNAIDKNKAELLAGTGYDVERIKKIALYASKRLDVAVAPVLVPGFNDDEIEKIIDFAKEIGIDKQAYFVGIQNFLNYRFGRNPCRQIPWEDFYSRLRELERKKGIKLILDASDFGIHKTRPLERPFKKGDVVKARIVCPGRLKGEMLAAVSERVISVPGCRAEEGKTAKIKITRAKHNIFMGKII